MEKVYQTIFSDNSKGVYGNCMSACVASLLEMSISDVPNFAQDKDWFSSIYDWLWGKGYELEVEWRVDSEGLPEVDFYMVWDMGPRGKKHSVIYSKGKLVHDPYPDGSGVLETEDRQYAWIRKL